MMIDISQEVFSGRVYPGDPRPAFNRIGSISAGDMCNLTEFSMCAHNGTHIDAPFHFFDDGKTVDKIELSVFVGDCYVARREGELTADGVIDIMETARSVDAAKRILIAGNAVVTPEAAHAFARSGIVLFGNESQTVGTDTTSEEIHTVMLGVGIVLLEGIVLDRVSEGKYFLSAAPLNLGGCDGAPCRAYLIG